MTRLTIAPAARTDLRDIRVYSKSAFGPRIARSYLDGIREQFVVVLLRQRAGRPEPDLGEGVRSIGFRSHRIYYGPMENGILIIRVLHHAQDVHIAFGASS